MTAGAPVAATDLPSRRRRSVSQPTAPAARPGTGRVTRWPNRTRRPRPSPTRPGILRACGRRPCLVVVVCLFAALFGRLWYLQGVEANTVAVKSVAGQGIETVLLPAPRGEIFDRNGVLLAGNRIEQVVTVAPGRGGRSPGHRGRAFGPARRTGLQGQGGHQ